MTIRHFFASLLVALPLAATAQVTDRIVFGNNDSETAHGLITYCPDNTATVADGLQGQTGRYVKPFLENPFAGDYPGIYGGEYCFVLRVDGSAQNYITLRTNGSEAYTDGSRYHVQIEGLNLQDYSRQAVDFSADKAPGAFCYNTLVIPRAVTDGKQMVTVRIRSLGRYWGYADAGNFAKFQYLVEKDLAPIYAAYSSTNPVVDLSDEVQGQRGSYAAATVKGATETLATMKTRVQNALTAAIKGEIEGSDFKPAYNNNNFNVVQCMGYAYQRGVYGTTAANLAKKIRAAIDSMVYVNNLVKAGNAVTVSAKGQTATTQGAGYGWGGLFGGQGMGMYLLWRAGKVTDAFLNQKPNLGNGTDKTRREQWIEAFRESFNAGLTYSGRRYITNQLMESAHSVYGAALALYALDQQTYHNAPKLGLRLMREAVGLDEYTGVPANAKFDGSIKDSDGYPTYELGDPATAQSSTNYWGHHFHATTAMGNGREQGWTCTSCYGNMAGRMCDMYIATLSDPFIGTTAVSDGSQAGDPDILMVATYNAKYQAYFTYPSVDSDGYRGIISESSMCWRNRYDPGKNYYGNLMAAYLSADDELMGHMLQAYKNGHYDPDTSGKLFPWYTNNYWLADALGALSDYAAAHDSDFTPVPSTDGQPDYVVGDAQDGVVAVKHGDNHLFVNFLANDCPLWSGQAHLVTPVTAKVINFAPEVEEFYHSGKTNTLSASYWNANHKIKYPDDPQMAYGGMTYEYPAYDAEGHYNGARTSCQYYQQLLGQYLVAQNCSETETYPLSMTTTAIASKSLDGLSALDIATGETVTLSAAITLAPLTTKVYFIASLAGGTTIATVPDASPSGSETLKARVADLLAFAQTASTQLSTDKTLLTYDRDAFMPFFLELTRAAYAANSGTLSADEITAAADALELAYQAFLASRNGYDACAVPGRMDYTKRIDTSGSVTIKSKTSIENAKSGAQVFIPIEAEAEADYIVKVRAKSHVADQYKSTLNVDVITMQQYLDGTPAVDPARTQQIAYSDFDYTVYQWAVHLQAGQTMVLRYTFGGQSATYTVDLSYTDIAAITAAEKLASAISEAQALLDSYEGSDLVSDEARQALASAINDAQSVADNTSATDSDIETAIETLAEAVTAFKNSATTLETHVLDLSTAVHNCNASHQSRWPDDSRTTALRANNWGKVYVGRYDINAVRQILVRSNIRSHQLYCYGLRAYAVPVTAGAAAITTVDQLNALSTTDSYRIATYYGDETVDGESLKEGNTLWKIGPQRIIDLRKKTLTANEADFQEKWGTGAVVPMTGYTYDDEEKTIVKDTYESAFNANFTPSEGLCDIFFQFGAVKWGEMTIGEVLVVTEESNAEEPEEPEDGVYNIYPVKDIQLRIGNSNQSGTGAAIEVRENTANNHEYGFCGIIEFDLTAIQQKIAEGYTISDAYLRLTDASNNASSNLVLKPFYSGWAEDKATTYDKNVEAVTAAAAAAALATLQLKRYGGKKAFELQNAATHVNPFPVSAYQGTSIGNEALIAYLTDSLSAGKTAVSLLVGREDGSTFGAGFYTKDVLNGLNDTKNCAQYEWSETDQKWVKIEGTDNSISRIAAAMQFFGLTEAEFQAECAPLLTITLQEPGENPDPKPEGTTYMLTTTWNGTDFFFNLPQEEGGIAALTATEAEVMLVPQGTGYVMATIDGSYYLAYKDGSNWDLVATASAAKAALLEVVNDNNIMTLKGDNGYMGINTKNTVAEGEPIYGDCNPSNHKTYFAYQWNVSNVTTGISQMENRQIENCKYFDLQGRRVNKPLRGLYIINGKKVVIK